MQFTFSWYGLLFFFGWIFLSLFIHWIYQENLKIKYSKINFNQSDSGIFLLKQRLNHLDVNWTINTTTNYWKNEINFPKKQIFLDPNMTDKNIYGLINCALYEIWVIHLNHKYFKRQLFFKITSFLLFLLINFFMLVSFYYVGLALFLLLLLLIIADYWLNAKIYQKIYALLQTKFSVIKDSSQAKFIQKYLKYKKYFWLYKYLILGIQPFFSVFLIFKNWNNEHG